MNNQLEQYKHVFFIGIGGISMSGIAEVLRTSGKQISGSDQSDSDITRHLESLGMTVHIGHSKENITDDFDLVVYTAAIKEDNVEYQRAVELGIKMMDRATILGLIMNTYNTSIGVAGTHGKTTTTSMLSYIMMEADLDPTISVGAILKGINGNFRIGGSDYFITEACEYSNSYHKFFPNINIILNIEEDHMDFFKDLEEIRQSFKTYIKNTKDNGILIINDSIPNIEELTQGINCQIVTVGSLSSSNYSYKNPSYNEKGLASFDLIHNGNLVERITLNVTGEHNIQNALATIAAASFMNVPMDAVKKGLITFGGADRRFEYIGTVNDVTIIDDYAHHPTEILKTIEAAKHIHHNDLWVVFQPHTYTRTLAFYDEFVSALSLIDHLIVTDIYAARELDPGNINSKMLVESLSNLGKDIVYIDDFAEICDYVTKHCLPNDMLITMGAGTVTNISKMLTK